MEHSTARRIALATAFVLAVTTGAADILPAMAAESVAFAGPGVPGTIVIRTSERRLYLIVADGRALRYPVGVGRAGRQWAGSSFIDAKFVEPNWVPPPAVRSDEPNLPDIIAGGSAANPMGAAAMTLSGTVYAIHGTNAPSSIGGFVSYGCIRMLNPDITDLFSRVRVGTPVIVTP